MDQTPILEVRDIRKRFPGVQALDGVHLEVYAGEVLALVGENGAGKSTLMKILSGVYAADSGTILRDGLPVVPRDPSHARDELGISIIHQEFNLAPNLSVAENIFLGREPRRMGFVRFDQLYRRSAEFLDLLGVHLDPRTLVARLSVGQQQMVEIAKALSYQAKLVIMDEPTAALSLQESATLMGIIRSLRAKGVGVIFITHRLEEVFQIADRVTVMRDGKTVGSMPVAETDRTTVVRLMVDRDLSEMYAAKSGPIGEPLLEVRNLATPGRLADISFTLHRGEILGFAGLVGAGRTEVADALFGVGPRPTGQIFLHGREVRIHSPADAVRHGIGYVTEDRKQLGLVLGMTVRENTTLAILESLCRGGFVRRQQERQTADRYIHDLGIRTPGRDQMTLNLSGGNQQKVVIAKWLAGNPGVLILDEPTRGIDVAAKAEVHAIIARLAEQGVGIIMISSDLMEVLAMSDRVLVMHEGRVTAEFLQDEATQERVMLAATGMVAGAI
ncbi:MAG TPA: sugar ABC transporter ATP-binding protein [Symbiobacteriaceae bacterium]|jgi:ribose transport system ATP-binding protein